MSPLSALSSQNAQLVRPYPYLHLVWVWVERMVAYITYLFMYMFMYMHTPELNCAQIPGFGTYETPVPYIYERDSVFIHYAINIASYWSGNETRDTIWRNQRTRKLRFVNFWISFRGTFHRECMAFLLT